MAQYAKNPLKDMLMESYAPTAAPLPDEDLSPMQQMLNRDLSPMQQMLLKDSAAEMQQRRQTLAFAEQEIPEIEAASGVYGLRDTFKEAAVAGGQQLVGDVKTFSAIRDLLAGETEQAESKLGAAEALRKSSGEILSSLGEFGDFVEAPTFDGFVTQVFKGIGQFTPMAVSSIASGFTGGAIATVGKGVLSQASRKVTKDMMKKLVKKHAMHKTGKGPALTANEKAIVDAAYATVRKAGGHANYLNVAKAGAGQRVPSAFQQGLAKFPAASTGFWAGAFGQEYVVGSSQALVEYDEAGYKLTEAEARAALKLGIPQAVLGTLGERLFVGALFKRAARDYVKKGSKSAANYMRELARGFGGGLIQGGTQEGLTELGQEELLIRQRMAIDPGYSQQEANLRRAESAFIGFWAGGARSAPTSAIANVFGLARSSVEPTNEITEAIKAGKITLPSEPVGDLIRQTKSLLGKVDRDAVWIPFDGKMTAAQKAGYWQAILEALVKDGAITNETASRLQFISDPEGTGMLIYDSKNPKSLAIAREAMANGFSNEFLAKTLKYTKVQDGSEMAAVVVRDKEGNVEWSQAVDMEDTTTLDIIKKRYAKQVRNEGWTVKADSKENIVQEREAKKKAVVRGFEGEETVRDPETGEIIDVPDQVLDEYGQGVTIQDEEAIRVTKEIGVEKSGRRQGQRQSSMRARRELQEVAQWEPVNMSRTFLGMGTGRRAEAQAKRAELEQKFFSLLGKGEAEALWAPKTLKEQGMETIGKINTVPDAALKMYIDVVEGDPDSIYTLGTNKEGNWIIVEERTPQTKRIKDEEIGKTVQDAISSPFNQKGARAIAAARQQALEKGWSIKKPGKEKYQGMDFNWLMILGQQINEQNPLTKIDYTTGTGFIVAAFDTIINELLNQGYKIRFAGKSLNTPEAWAAAADSPLMVYGKKKYSYNQAKAAMGREIPLERLTERQADALNAAGMNVKKGDPVPSSTELKALLDDMQEQVVDGGTGWAVQMAIDAGKPAYVFDKGQWYVFEDGKFVETKRPDLTKDHAIIGTREAQPKFVERETGEKVMVNEAFNKQIRNQIAALYRDADESYENHSGGAIGVDMIGKEIGEKKGVKQNHYYVDGKKTPGGNVAIDPAEAKTADVALEKANETLNRKINEKFVHLLQRNKWQVDNSEAIFAFAPLTSNPTFETIQNLLNKGLISPEASEQIITEKIKEEIALEEQGLLFMNLKTNPDTNTVMMVNEKGVLESLSNTNIRLRDEKPAKAQLGTPKLLGITATFKGKKIVHFTLPENVAKIIEEGYDTTLAPIHKMTGQKDNKLAENVLYFTMDADTWSTTEVYVGEGKGDTDFVYYDYESEAGGGWVTEKKAAKKVNLAKVEAVIKEKARVLTIDSLAKLRNYAPGYNKEMVQNAIKKARADGYDVVNIKFKDAKKWETEADSGEIMFDTISLRGGKDDYFVLNKEAIEVGPAKARPAPLPKLRVDLDPAISSIMKGALPVLTKIVNEYFGKRNLTVFSIQSVLDGLFPLQLDAGEGFIKANGKFDFDGKEHTASDVMKILAAKMQVDGKKGKWIKFGDTEVILLNIPENPTTLQLGEIVLALGHELGHSIYNQTLNNTLINKNMRQRLQKAFETDKKNIGTVAYEGKYGFEEWFADKTGSWLIRQMGMQQAAKATNAVDSFFKRLAKRIIGVFTQLDQMLQKRFATNLDFDAYVNELSQAIRDNKASVSVTQEIEIRDMVDDILEGAYNDVAPKSLIVKIKNKAIQTLKSAGEKLPTDRSHWGVEYLLLPAHNLLKRVLKRAGVDPAFADMIYNPSQSKAATGTLNGRISLMYMRLNELGKLAPKKKNGDPDIDAWGAILEEAEANVPIENLKTNEAKKVRQFLEDFFRDNIEGKDDTIKWRKNFYPRIVDILKIQDNKNGERAALAQVIVKYNKDIPLDVATRYVEAMIRENETNPDDPHDGVSEVSLGMAKKRSEAFAKIPNEALREIDVIKDPYVALVTYVQDMTKRIDYQEKVTVQITKEDIQRAVKLGEETRQKNLILPEGAKQLDNPLGFLLASGVQPGNAFNGWQASEVYINRVPDPKERAKARAAVRSMLGKTGMNMPKWARHINSALLTLNIITMLTFATLASLPDLGGTVLRSKDFSAIKTFGQQWGKYFKSRDEMRAFARDVGVISFDSLNTMYLNAHELGFMGNWGKFASEKFFIATGLEAYTKFTRVFAAGMAEQFLLRKAADDSDIATRHLEELHVTREEIRAWIKDGRSFESMEGVKVRAAIARFVDEAIVRPNSAERPGWASNPHFALVWQLKSFFYAYGKNIIGGALRESSNRYAEDGKLSSAALPLVLGATALLPLTMLGLEIREMIKYFGRGMDPVAFQSDLMTWPQYSKDVIDRSGALGAFGLIIPMLDAGKYGGQWWVPTLGPTAERAEKLWTGRARGKDYLPLYDLGAGQLLGL